MNLTPTEYDQFTRVNGVRAALAQFPYTLCYRWASMNERAYDHTLFFSSELERQSFADGVRRLKGTVTGASGGDIKLYK